MTENKILSNIYMESKRFVSISNSSTKGARNKLKKFAGFKSIEKYSAKLFSEGKIALSERQLKLKDDKKIKGVFADLTYEYLTELYNLDVEKKRDERNKFNKIVRQGVSKLAKPNTTVEFKWNGNVPLLIEFIKKATKYKVMLVFGTRKIILNSSNTIELLERLKSGKFFVDAGEEYKSGASITQTIMTEAFDTIVFKSLPAPSSKARTTKKGKFFPFLSLIPDLDLSELQIYPTIESVNYEECCFINALRFSNVDEKEINTIKILLQTNAVSFKSLKIIAEELNYCFKVRNNSRSREVGKGEKIVKLGLIQGHYIPIVNISITPFAIENYHRIKHIDNWKCICSEITLPSGNKTFKRDNKKTMDSMVVVEKMLECDLFIPMKLEEELYATTHHTKIQEIGSLEYDVDINTKKNEYFDKKELRISSPKFHGKDRISFAFDFETSTEGVKHIPYMCCLYNDEVDECFYGKSCAYKMFKFIRTNFPEYEIFLIAHNAGYDLRFIYQELMPSTLNVIQRGHSLLQATGKLYNFKNDAIPIIIQDSYAFIASPLSQFGKMFKLDQSKEIIPYSLYTSLNVKKRFIKNEDCIQHLHRQFKCKSIGDKKDINYLVKRKLFVKEFYKNCEEWNCMETKVSLPSSKGESKRTEGSFVDIIKYSQKYCRMDCIVLWKGWNTFKGWIQDVSVLDIEEYVSLPSLANDHMLKNGVYDNVYMLSGNPRAFIQKCMVGGRTMCAENKKHHIKKEIADYDGVSLYPSSMDRIGEIGGYLMGVPKVLEQFDYDYVKSKDGYFVEAVVKKVGNKKKFPLLSKIDDDTGVRNFNNEMEGMTIYVDKFSLEDLIQFQGVEVEIMRGYYYDEGRNPNIKDTINFLFNERKKKKKERNPIETVFKLLMNASYGKTLLKPFDTQDKYIGASDYESHIVKNFDAIKEIIELAEGSAYLVKHRKEIDNHYNNAPVGVEVLSMSKRIMNEVMCLGEDIGCEMFYQDTDSIHICLKDVVPLEDAYRNKYNRELNGKDLGQFHIDFSSSICKGELKAVESIFLGKKCYVDKLVGDDPEVFDYHIRMKGISNQSISHYSEKLAKTKGGSSDNFMEIYKDLFDGEKLTFDLACDGLKCCFEFDSNFTIKNKYIFERVVKF